MENVEKDQVVSAVKPAYEKNKIRANEIESTSN